MPVYTGSTLTGLSYDELVSWINLSSGGTANIDAYIAEAAKYGVDEIGAVEDFATTYMNFYKDGSGNYTITSFNNSAQINSVNSVDSNVSTIARGNVQTPLNRGVDSITGKLNITKFPASGSFGQQASYVLGSVGSAVAAVSTGITLGKAIDGALYNANPDYWDSIGLSSLNPETWNSITNGDDSWQAGLFNIILGLDPNTGQSQAYLDENALAYMAYALAQNGWFGSGNIDVTNTPSGFPDVSTFIPFYAQNSLSTSGSYNTRQNIAAVTTFSSPTICLNYNGSKTTIFYSSTPNAVINSETHIVRTYKSDGSIASETTNQYTHTCDRTYTFDGKTVYYVAATGATDGVSLYEVNDACAVSANPLSDADKLAWLALYNGHSSANLPGVSNQENATLPDVSTWNDIPSTLNSLRTQYPNLWNNALTYDNYQPDGTNPHLVYIPVALPNTTNPTDTQPTTGTQTQTSTIVSPSISPETLIELITKIATEPNPQTQPETQPSPDYPPQNPIQTGTGSTPTLPTPSGSASALWSVYHPSQTELNSFGAWLWTDNIITQIQQVLQNPMEGIITLHKVFATPVDSGTGTIVVGRLDSEVPSATVSQQYVFVDCGSIDCFEEFGNVFDYSPHTNISLYLPFIGIVPLNTDEVMRGTINVTYGVDVFTGACLAMIEVTRDANTINMYQYSGVASVEYPLTGSVHGGLINGLLGIASGVAGIALASTGAGAAAGAAVAAGGAANALKSSTHHSSGFSGNAGAMGIKKPYLIIERPQTKVASTFPYLNGYPSNVSGTLSEFSGQVVVKHVHVEGIPATDTELSQIEALLKEGILI